jgi:hypothetical protein
VTQPVRPVARTTIKTNFTFGVPVAEHDPYVVDAYVDNGTYEVIKSRTEPRSFIIGRTGSGKSAALRLLAHEYPEKVIRIAPENLALTYITNLDVMPRLLDLGVQLEPFLKALWKHVFIVEILRHRYTINTPEQKFNILSYLKNKFRQDPGKIAAIEYLDQFGDRFWCETHERVQQIAYTFEQKFKTSGGINTTAGALGAMASGDFEQVERQEERSELASRYQRIVNEVQIPRLNKMMELLNTEILDQQHFTYIVIDDLDKEWVDERFVNLLIRCLLQAVMDMRSIAHLKILVALRTNIFQQLNYGATRRGEQEEKVRAFTLDMRWQSADLRRLLERRAEVASQSLSINPPLTLDAILPKTSKRILDPMEYILSRTLMRPRDAILFLNACLRVVIGKESMTMDDVYEGERLYSEERLIALRDEWKDPYLGIDRVFEQFRAFPRRFPRNMLTECLDQIALLLADTAFPGRTWLEPLCEGIWSPGSESRSWLQNYGGLARLLYDVGFIGVVRSPTKDDRKSEPKEAIYSYEEPNLLMKMDHIPETARFEIHPAFQQALSVTQEEVWYS